MKLSVVSTIYNSNKTIREFIQRAKNAVELIDIDEYEIVVVNDGSPDNSIDILKQIASGDKNIKIVDLTRNFGHHKAMMTGLKYCDGDRVFLIDSDLEESPEWLTSFWEIMKNRDADVIFGVQEKRRGNLFQKLTGEINYKVINWLSNCNHPKNIATARLMTRRYVKSLLNSKRKNLLFHSYGCWQDTHRYR